MKIIINHAEKKGKFWSLKYEMIELCFVKREVSVLNYYGTIIVIILEIG